MNQKIKEYIPKANEILTKYQTSISPKLIDKELKGYIASLGASILMSGLIPTLAVFAADDTNSQAARYLVLDWISKLIRTENKANAQQNAKDFFESALKVPNELALEQEILNASIALKLCIRTFKLTK